MPRARRILFSSLIAVGASSLAAALAQDGAGGRAAVEGPGAQAGRGQPRAAAAKPPIQIEELLRLWEGQSKKLKTLDVWIYRIDKNPAWGEEIHYQGRAKFKSPQLAYLDFKKIKTAKNAQGKLVPVPDPKNPKQRILMPQETIICSKDAIWQYLFPVQQIFIFPLAKEQRQRALDEGPLPFLFNMKAQEAKDRYTMHILGETPKYYSILVEPKLKEDQEAFKKAQIILDTTYLLPVRIVLISPDQKSSKDFQVEHIVPNAVVDDKFFQGRELAKWKIIRNPNAQGPQMQGNIGAANGQPAGAVPARR
jgi:TIGR03009 family protein